MADGSNGVHAESDCRARRGRCRERRIVSEDRDVLDLGPALLLSVEPLQVPVDHRADREQQLGTSSSSWPGARPERCAQQLADRPQAPAVGSPGARAAPALSPRSLRVASNRRGRTAGRVADGLTEAAPAPVVLAQGGRSALLMGWR